MSSAAPPSATELEDGRLLFAQAWGFSRGSPDLDHLPPADRPEVAFAGRSNVGKSSLINALTGRLNLARASNTPGRTQELNYFTDPANRLYVVDMPGYGYAEAPKNKVALWNAVLRAYLSGRNTLLRVFVLVDARHGLKPSDTELMTMLDTAAVSYQVVLTKSDKISTAALAGISEKTESTVAKHPAAFPAILQTSAEKGEGIAELRAAVARLIIANSETRASRQ